MKFFSNKLIAAIALSLMTNGALATTYKFKGIVDVVNGRLFPQQYIEIENDKIVKLKDHLSVAENFMDYSSFYLSPGLIDAHTHIFVSQFVSDQKKFSNALVRELGLSKSERMTRAKKYLKQYLAEGFTSIFDLGNSGHFYDVELRNEIAKDSNYPLMFVSGPGMAAAPGQFPPATPDSQSSTEYRLIDRNTNIDNVIDEYVKNKTDMLKIYLDNYPGPGSIDESILAKILKNPKIKSFKKITFHSFNPESGTLLKKFKIKNTEHFNFYLNNNLPESLKFITPTNFDAETLKQFNEFTPAYYLLQQNTLKSLYHSKTKLLFGADFYFEEQNAPNFNRAKIVKRTLNSYIEAQVDSKDIIKIMTYYPALSIGMEKYIGQIKVGSKANLIGTKDNPLDKISALFDVGLVINKGKVVLVK